MKLKKFTFKKTIHYGQYRSFEKDHTTIKLNKKEVGYISEVEWNKYFVHFAVKKERTKDSPADFKWFHLKRTFEKEIEAREWIKSNNNKIQEQLDLYYFDEGE